MLLLLLVPGNGRQDGQVVAPAPATATRKSRQSRWNRVMVTEWGRRQRQRGRHGRIAGDRRGWLEVVPGLEAEQSETEEENSKNNRTKFNFAFFNF